MKPCLATLTKLKRPPNPEGWNHSAPVGRFRVEVEAAGFIRGYVEVTATSNVLARVDVLKIEVSRKFTQIEVPSFRQPDVEAMIGRKPFAM